MDGKCVHLNLPLDMVSWSFKNLTTTSWLAPSWFPVYLYNYSRYIVSIEMHSALHGSHTCKNVYCLVHHLCHWLFLFWVLYCMFCEGRFVSPWVLRGFFFIFRPEGWIWSVSKILIENHSMFLSCFASQAERLIWVFPLKQIKSSSFFILTWFHNKEIDINWCLRFLSLHFLTFQKI